MAAPVEPKQRSIPFSTHARGVPLFDRTRFFDLPRHVARMLLDLRDISSSLFWFLTVQTWLTLWSFLITLISVVFFSFYTENGKELSAPLDWVLICFVAVLPSVGFLWIAYMRRERALDELAKVRVLMLGIFTAHRDWVPAVSRPPGHLQAVQEAIAIIVDAMQAYFTPVRFYSRWYPYFGYRSAMVHIALERTRQMRRISSSMEQLEAATLALHDTSVPPQLVAQLHDRTLQLQLAIQRMANIKEYRTPQGVRSLCRFFLLFFMPVFFGPYWSWVHVQTNFAFAFFFSILLQIAVTGLVNATIALEDPFANNAMDGVFIEEALYEIEQLVGAPPPDMEGMPTTSLSGPAAEGAAPAVAAAVAAAAGGRQGSSPFAAVSRSAPAPLSPAKSAPPAADTV